MAEVQKRRPGRPKDEGLTARRREEILEAAAKIFAERGFAATDLQVLADELAVGKGTIYRYFPSKRELFLAAVDRGMRCLTEEIHAAKENVTDCVDMMLVAIRAYLAFFDAHPKYVELIIQERAAFRDRKKPTYFEHRDAMEGRKVQMLRDLMAQGRMRDMPPERAVDVMNNLLYGTIFTNYFVKSSKPLEQQAHDIVDIFWHGVLSEEERKRRLSGAAEAET
jgi:AcrR family transcriptional regulator